ncbi:MAG: LuxR C-terminal-related transcriptional regulator [Anaerolineaceae bacterium]
MKASQIMLAREDGIEQILMLSSKFNPLQQRSDIIHRTALVERINDNIQKGVILISAPAGFGKTTLAADWAAQTQYPVVWVSLEKMDDSPSIFLQTLLQGLQKTFPDTVFNNLDIHRQFTQPGSFQNSIIEMLDQIESLPEKFVIVFDDFQLIKDEKVTQGIVFLLNHLPPNLRLLIVSRVDPNLNLARLRAMDRLEEIRTLDLRFSYEDSKQFLRKTMKIDLEDEKIDLLVKKTEGWITGLQLAAITLRQNKPVKDLSGQITGNNIYVLDFLMEEVFDQQPEDIQEFLLRTSILENLIGPLCEALMPTGFPKGKGQWFLHSLYHSNLFVIPLDFQEHWFRYHPLFAESLRHILNERHPEEIKELNYRASVWYQENGFLSDAVRHAEIIKDFDRIIEIITINAEKMIKERDILTVFKWIQCLPNDKIQTNPSLCILYAWGLVSTFNTEGVLYWLTEAFQALRLPQEISLDNAKEFINDLDELTKKNLGMIYGIHSLFSAINGDAQESEQLNQNAFLFLSDNDLLMRSYISLEKSISYLLDLNLDGLEESLNETILSCDASGNWMLAVITRSYLGHLFILRGQLSKAWDLLNRSFSLSLDDSGNPMAFAGYLYIEMGSILLERNELVEAQQYISMGIELSKDWPQNLIAFNGHLYLAYIKQLFEDWDGVKREIAFAYDFANSTNNELDDFSVSIVEIKLALLRGDLRTGLNWAKRNGFLDITSSELKERFNFYFSSGIQINLARIWLGLSRLEKQTEYIDRALLVLDELLVDLQEREVVPTQIEVLLLKALVYQESGDVENALLLLQDALQIGEPEGFYRIYLEEGVYLEKLISKLLLQNTKEKSNSIFPSQEYLLKLLSLFSENPEINSESVSREPKESSANLKAEFNLYDSEVQIYGILTARENEILQLVAKGASNAEIAQALCLAVNTVKRHLNNIFNKLGAKTRTQAVAIARKYTIIE